MNMVAGGERIAIETNNSAKPVIQYDLKGKCIAKYNSQLEAAASVGLLDSTAISKCCITKSGSAKGFIWRFEGDLLDLNLDSIHSVPICQYDFKGNLIATYMQHKRIILKMIQELGLVVNINVNLHMDLFEGILMIQLH